MDLTKLKDLGGPFTTADEVDTFMCTDLSDSDKVSRLYLEVRYHRDTCVSLPKSSEIFKLKRGYKNLVPAEYATNLKIYLGKINCVNRASMVDLKLALLKLNN